MRRFVQVSARAAILVLAVLAGCAHTRVARLKTHQVSDSTEPSDNCLAPEQGAFAPAATWERQTIERYALIPEGRLGQVTLSVYRDKGGASSDLLMVREQGPGSFDLELRTLANDPWEVAMNRFRTKQPGIRELSPSRQLGETLADLELPKPKKLNRKLGQEVAGALIKLWGAMMQRVEHSSAKASDAVGHGDGVSYHFWGQGMSGMTQSPAKGSLMSDVVELLDKVCDFAGGRLSEVEILRLINVVAKRAGSTEDCLRTSRDR